MYVYSMIYLVIHLVFFSLLKNNMNLIVRCDLVPTLCERVPHYRGEKRRLEGKIITMLIVRIPGSSKMEGEL